MPQNLMQLKSEFRNRRARSSIKDLAILVSHLVLLDLWKNAIADAWAHVFQQPLRERIF
jgi:hypothetical protein